MPEASRPPEADSRREADSQPEAGSEPGTDSQPEAGSEPGTDSQPEAGSEPGTVSWGDLLAEARCRLAASTAVDTPDVDARRIVEAASGASPAEFESVLGRPPTTLTAARFGSMLARRCEGEPLQYVLGSWGFRTLDLMVDRRVLIPRPETEVVAGWAVDETARLAAGAGRGREVVVVDLGTGSGAIALSVAVECPQARVFATDVSSDALAVARANLAGVGRAAIRVSLHEGDWYEALPGALRGSVDVVVSNPPYIGTSEELPPVVADWEPPVALWSGPAGHEAVEQVIGGASQWLKPGGSLVMEAASHRAHATAHMAEEAGFTGLRVEQDLAGLDRVVIGHRS